MRVVTRRKARGGESLGLAAGFVFATGLQTNSMVMKKYFIALFLITPFLAFAQGFDQDLFYGLKANEDVKELQEFLTDKGFYNGPITGNFFSLTLTAVKKFQTAYSITPISGYFGPKSRAKTNELLLTSGVSKTEIATEAGTIPVPAAAPSKTTTDVVSSLTEQIKILQQQLALLQQQNQQLSQQTQTLQQIQQQTVSTPTSITPVVRPEIIRFEASKSTANIGDEVTLSWEAKNAVTCAIVETDDISIPFTGRLPTGSVTIRLAESANAKIPLFRYYAICADKDWNTAKQSLSVNVSGLIEIKNAHACKTDLKTEYLLSELLQNGNIDGRISMRIYLAGVNEQPTGNPELVVKTGDPSQNRIFKGGASSSCGYTYGEYNFYTTKTGSFPITFSIPAWNISKTIIINVK